MKRNVSVVRLIVGTRSSGPPASQPVIQEMPVSVASGTPYIIILNSVFMPTKAERLMRNVRWSKNNFTLLSRLLT